MDYGAQSGRVQKKRKDHNQSGLVVLMHIQGTGWAFAAILEDGSVVTWGHAAYGGDSSAVRDQLKGV